MDIAERVKECRYAGIRKTWVITPEIRILGVLALHKTSLDVICKRTTQETNSNDFHPISNVLKTQRAENNTILNIAPDLTNLDNEREPVRNNDALNVATKTSTGLKKRSVKGQKKGVPAITTKQKNEKKFLIEAGKKGKKSIDSMMKLLSENQVNINVQDAKGNTALHLAVGSNEKMGMLLNRKPTLEMSLFGKPTLEIRNKMGETVLHLAAIRGSEKITKLLIENGANANSINKSKLTALEEAERAKKTKVAKFLKGFTYKRSGGDKIEY